MKHFTLGFIFNKNFEKVLLIHKLRPEWQSGKVNGLGGKIELGESSLDCVVREIQEESGLSTIPANWKYVGKMGTFDWDVNIYSYVYTGDTGDIQDLEDERVEWFDIKSLPNNSIENLPWLIHLCLNKEQTGKPENFVAAY